MSEGLNLQGIEQLILSGSLAVQTHKRCSPGIWQNLCIRTKILPMQTRIAHADSQYKSENRSPSKQMYWLHDKSLISATQAVLKLNLAAVVAQSILSLNC